MVAPWAYKDKKLVSLKISTDPSYFWSNDSKTDQINQRVGENESWLHIG